MNNDGLMSRHNMGVAMTKAINDMFAAEEKVERVRRYCSDIVSAKPHPDDDDFDFGRSAACKAILKLIDGEQA